MSFCSKCKTQVNDDVTFCPSCGAPVGEQKQQGQNTKQSNFVSNAQNLSQMSNTTAEHNTKDITDNKIMAVLAYFGPLVLIPILAAPKSKFARFHANQGLLVLIGEVAYGIIQAILMAILRAAFPWNWSLGYLGGRGAIFNILSSVLSLVWIVLGILAIIGLINAVQGKFKKLPIIGKIKIIK